MEFVGKFFFIKECSSMVYCHHQTASDNLILGGLSRYFSDAYTNFHRQKISVKKFMELNPESIPNKSPEEYKNLKPCPVVKGAYIVSDVENGYRTNSYKQNTYLLGSEMLPDIYQPW